MRLFRMIAWIPAVALAGAVGLAVGIGFGARYHGQVGPHLERMGWKQPDDQPTAKAGGTTDQHPLKLDKQYYTCAMHPQVIKERPGLCPICHMDLQLMDPANAALALKGMIEIDPVMVQNMGVRTTMPVLGYLNHPVRAVGTLAEPEENHHEINLRVNGWIQKLYANRDGMPVNQGDRLFDLYSPEITAAADELITARKAAESAERDAGKDDPIITKSAQALLAAARRRLGLLGLTDEQVAEMEKLERAPATITIVSPMHGHIAGKNIIEGSAVKAGEELMKIADRSSMWMIVQVFERDLPLVRLGSPAKVTVAAFPGKEFTEGKVDFIYPHLDPATRTAQVRIVLPNLDHALHENMFGAAEIAGAPETEEGVLVPREAVIDSGKRQIVFLDLGKGHFEARDVTVGLSGNLGDGREMVRIMSGLTEHDAIVVSGQFLLDSESRIAELRQKLLAPEAPAADTGGMDMGGMDMGGMDMGGGDGAGK